MRGSVRLFAVFAVTLLGCGEDPKPLTGLAYWADACPMSACRSETHQVRGSRGSSTVDVDCSLADGVVFFKIGALDGAQTNFDESSAGIRLQGTFNGVGEVPNGRVDIAGLGWRVAGAPVGPAVGATGPGCRVFVDTIRNGGFVGRISCVNVNDSSSPPRQRLIRGFSPPTASGDYGEFVFENCTAQ